MSGGVVEGKEHTDGEENMAAWLVGIKTLKIEPYHLPPLGKILFPACVMFFCPGHVSLTCVSKHCAMHVKDHEATKFRILLTMFRVSVCFYTHAKPLMFIKYMKFMHRDIRTHKSRSLKVDQKTQHII